MFGSPCGKQLDRIEYALGRIEFMFNQLFIQGRKEMASIADLQAAVTAQKTVADSVVTLLTGIAAQLAAAIAANDPAQVQAVLDGLTANTAELQAAVTANTPAA